MLGGEEDLAAWVEQLNAYAAATGMTAQEMQTMLSSVGVTANVESDYQEQEMTVPTFREEVTNVHLQKVTGTRSKFNDDGSVSPVPYTEWVPEYTRASVPSEPLKTTGYVEVASISMVGPDGKTASPPKFTGRRAPSPSAKKGSGKGGGKKGGGGSAAPTKVEKTKKSDVVDRYKRVDDKLDDVAKKMNDASRAADRLYGKNRINQMKKVSKALEEEVDLLTQKRKEAEDYLKVDKDALKTAAKKAGVSFTFDE